MARKEPKKDIRDDGRHIPLEHHTARGDVPRNSGNFTRGSQLLTTQVWMWSQGARLPLVMWLVLFALSYFIILSVTLNENNFQLICMRILSALWDWVALDNLKQVNLRLPDNSVHRTVMGYVPYQPAAEVDFSGRRSARPRRHDDKQDTGFGCDLADEGEDQRVFGLSNEQKRL